MLYIESEILLWSKNFGEEIIKANSYVGKMRQLLHTFVQIKSAVENRRHWMKYNKISSICYGNWHVVQILNSWHIYSICVFFTANVTICNVANPMQNLQLNLYVIHADSLADLLWICSVIHGGGFLKTPPFLHSIKPCALPWWTVIKRGKAMAQ